MKSTLISVLVTFFIGAWLVLLIFMFNIGYETPPLRFADIPQQTIDFLTKLKSQIVVYNPNPRKEDWNNNKAGDDYLKSYKCLEDENFIVFYTPNTPSEKHAKETLITANHAIKPLEQMMGKYYYPKMLNNRKLQFFVTNTRDEYNKIVTHLIRSDFSDQWSTGITCYELSSMGVLTLGIVLSDRTWENASVEHLPGQRVIWHEMNHYVYLTSLDLNKIQQPYAWHLEGVAEYFAGADRSYEIKDNKLRDIDLSHDLKNYYDNYWVGCSVMKYIHVTYGALKTKDYIKRTYNTEISASVQKEFNTSLADFDRNWEAYIRMNY